jgi:hypothetical protein
MKLLLKFLSDDSAPSCGRLMALMSLLMGAGVAFATVYLNRDMAGASPIVGIFVASAFGGHVAGKYMERDGK